MNAMPEIAIVGPNTLTAIGLKTLINMLIPQAVIRSFANFQALVDDTPDMYAHYFITATVYLEHAVFFQSRRRKVIVLVGEYPTLPPLDVNVLNICVPEAELLQHLLALHKTGHGDAPRQLAKQDVLSRREIEVLVLVTKGLINKEIADRLHIGLTTVITHRRNIVRKLQLRSVAHLTMYAIANGYVDDAI
jgi:DNA-binding CsgD family transcriptional regulator